MVKIKILSTKNCSYCQALKKWLDERKVKYEDVDANENPKIAEDFVKRSGQLGVPQIEINGKIIVGFDKEAIEKELKHA